MKKIVLISSLLIMASSAYANGPKNPWQDCGLGAMVFPENGAAAAISNIIWDLGTTAVSSQATTPESCAGAEVASAQLIIKSYDSITQQLATGSGNELQTLLSLNGCDQSTSAKATNLLRNEYAQSLDSVDLSNIQNRSEILFNSVKNVTGTACNSNS